MLYQSKRENSANSNMQCHSIKSTVQTRFYTIYTPQASLVALLVKNLPTMQETWVRSLGWEDPLEKGKAMYSSVLAWELYGELLENAHGVAESRTRLSNFHFYTFEFRSKTVHPWVFIFPSPAAPLFVCVCVCVYFYFFFIFFLFSTIYLFFKI